MIRIQFIGNLGKDATINIVGEQKVINFNVAHTKTYKDAQGNKVDKTTWVSCSYWVKNDILAQYLKKGKKVYVEGEPSADYYNQTGGTSAGLKGILKCRVENVQLLDRAENNGGHQTNTAPSTTNSTGYIDPNDITEPMDDLPF